MVTIAIMIILVMVSSSNDSVDIYIGVCMYESEFSLSRQGGGKPSNSDQSRGY